MKALFCILLLELCMLFPGNVVHAQVLDDCIPPIGPSNEGRHLADAIRLDTLSSTFHFVDARDSRQFTSDTGAPANDIYYTFVLEQPMDVIIHHFCSEITSTNLLLYKIKGPEESPEGGLLKTIANSQSMDFFGTRHIWEPYLLQMPEFNLNDFGRGFICLKMLEKGTYYVMSEGQGNYNGIIGTTIRGFAPEGNQSDYPLSIGEYAQSFNYEDTKDMRMYTPNYNGNTGSDIFYSFTLLRPMDITISQTLEYPREKEIDLLQANGMQIGSSKENLFVSNLPPGTYKVVSWVDGNQRLSTRIKGNADQLDGDGLTTPIDIGKHSESFTSSSSHQLNWFTDTYGNNSLKDIFFKFELQHPMDIHISTCGSKVPQTDVTLLNSSGTKLTDSYISPGGICYSPEQATLTTENLAVGIYYAVVEGEGDLNEMSIFISGDEQAEIVPDPKVELTENRNYISTIQPTIETATLANLSLTQSAHTINYFDGFGRSSQIVARGASPSKKDVVTFQEYDTFGRESFKWLPIVVSGKGGYIEKTEVKNASLFLYQGDHNAYSYPIYEDSPLNRVLEEYGSGERWQANGKSVKTAHKLNVKGDQLLNCIRYQVSDVANTSMMIENRGDYDTAQLFVTRTTNEDGQVSFEFTNKSGQVILSRQIIDESNPASYCDTYFIYDDGGRIRSVLPPLASDCMKSQGSYSSLSSEPLEQYAYFYQYDYRNRCIAKKLPGVSWMLYVYDNADHAILSQDGNLRKRSEWSFSIPDIMGRVVLTGICKNSLSNAQNYLKGVSVIAKRSTDIGGTTYKGYSISGILLVSPTLHTVSYYDNYTFLGQHGFPSYAYDSSKEAIGYDTWHKEPNKAYVHKDLLTGTISLPLQSGDPTIYSVSYYDRYKRMIQTHSSNHLGGRETECKAYDFTGKVLKRQHTHSANGEPTQVEEYAYIYDHSGRLLRTKHRLNAGEEILLAENSYDNLGRIKTNKKHSCKEMATDYTYNIRSWLKSASTENLFKQTLYYDELHNNNSPCYNGNISAMSWKTSSENVLHSYSFRYDPSSRLTAADYLKDGVSSTNYTTSYAYNKQGNMTSLQRYGKTGINSFNLIDNLSFTSNGNQLKAVNDAATASAYAGGFEFKDGARATIEYSYDANGNLTQDLNKKITGIQYNYLNLPSRMDFEDGSSISYLYEATGKKLRVVHSIAGKNTTTDYCGNVIYENGTPKTFLHEAGYISLSDKKYHYYIQDHQGNNRLVVSQNGTVEEVNHYYPFGGTFASSSNSQPYKYNGKELDRKNGLDWYDYGARHYDAALGRWHAVDPMSEKLYPWNPYVYCLDSPIKKIDPTGKYGETVWDVFSVVTGVKSLADNIEKGNVGAAIVDGVGIILDVAAVALPVVPGGASVAIKGARAVDKVADAVGTEKAVSQVTKAVHGNSKMSTKAQHAYDIKEVGTGNVVKTGVSGGKIRQSDGKSLRAEKQVRKWNGSEGAGKYESVITHKEPAGKGSRDNILDYEKKQADKLRDQNQLKDYQKHKIP